MAENPTMIWLIVKTGASGTHELAEAWLSEESARRSANRQATGKAPFYSLHPLAIEDA